MTSYSPMTLKWRWISPIHLPTHEGGVSLPAGDVVCVSSDISLPRPLVYQNLSWRREHQEPWEAWRFLTEKTPARTRAVDPPVGDRVRSGGIWRWKSKWAASESEGMSRWWRWRTRWRWIRMEKKGWSVELNNSLKGDYECLLVKQMDFNNKTDKWKKIWSFWSYWKTSLEKNTKPTNVQ